MLTRRLMVFAAMLLLAAGSVSAATEVAWQAEAETVVRNMRYGGHGGRDETMAMMYLYPDTVDLGELGEVRPRWAQDAHEATSELGEKVARAIVAGWVKELKKES